MCVNQSLWLSDISQILRTEFDQHGYRPPRGVLPNWIVRIASWFDGQLAGIVPMLDVEVKYDHSRIESLLGIRFLSLEESLVDMGHSMIEHNMIPRLSTYTGREKNTSPSD